CCGSQGTIAAAHLQTGEPLWEMQSPKRMAGEPFVLRMYEEYLGPPASPSSAKKIHLPSGEIAIGRDQSCQLRSVSAFWPGASPAIPRRRFCRIIRARPSRAMSCRITSPAPAQTRRCLPDRFTARRLLDRCSREPVNQISSPEGCQLRPSTSQKPEAMGYRWLARSTTLIIP